MKLKLDENLGNEARTALEAAGHDVTVADAIKLRRIEDSGRAAGCRAGLFD